MGRVLRYSLFLIFVSACVPIEKINYFNDIQELEEPVANPRLQKTIMPFDKIYIRVLSIDPQVSTIFTSTDQVRGGGAETTGTLGYLVDEKGIINFPFVGEIKVGSLTTTQAAKTIQEALSDYVASTSVVVSYFANQVTVIGEVTRQGMYGFTQDKLNIYEALGLGGGISRYGDRKKVMLIRHEGEKIMQYRLNLSDSKIANKEYYYVYPNDVILVEPLKAASSSYANITYTTILSTVTTLIAVLFFMGWTVE